MAEGPDRVPHGRHRAAVETCGFQFRGPVFRRDLKKGEVEVRVSFLGGDYLPARKLYVDPHLDLAFLEIAPEHWPAKLEPARLDCGAMPAVGHAVGAFGHPWDLSYTGTRGIISGVTAKYTGMLEMLQTDAPINPGNSGGPLISLKTGKVVGVNTASRKSSQNTNFAVPMKHACRILDLLRVGKDPSPPELPVSFIKDVDETNRLVVARVHADAERVQLREGDVVRAIDGESGVVENRGQLLHLLRGRLDDAGFRIRRGEQELVVRGALKPTEPMTARRGVFVAGVLFAANPWREFGELVAGKLALMVHHVERGSAGEAQKIEQMDLLLSLDGEQINDLDRLFAKLREAAEAKHTVSLKFVRVGDIEESIFTYVERPLPILGTPRFVGGE